MRRGRRPTVRWEDTPEPAVNETGIASIALEQALGELPEQLANAFVLVKCEQLCYREAAEVLGIPQGTVQFHVHEASKRLRKSLSEALPEPAIGGCV